VCRTEGDLLYQTAAWVGELADAQLGFLGELPKLDKGDLTAYNTEFWSKPK
jgi:hypothetical protein